MAGPVFGESGPSIGVHGQSTAFWGVHGRCLRDNTGVFGLSKGGTGVHGHSEESDTGSRTGVVGSSKSGLGIHGHSDKTTGILGFSKTGWGVHGASGSDKGVGVRGEGDVGVSAYSRSHYAVEAIAPYAVVGRATDIPGGSGTPGVGVYGTSGTSAVPGTAGAFIGNVVVAGSVSKYGGGFKIDHPLAPAEMYLNHSFVESSEMKNVYDGVAQLDADGTASVDLPEWFEALNGDFRYQLTAVGGAAPNLHVAEEIYENRFRIAGGEEGMRVCWQVTGSRKDLWAAANSLEVEEEKSQEERGRYLQPHLYGAPEEQRVRIGSPVEDERLRPPQAPEMPPGFEPPEAPEMPPSYVSDMQAEHRQQMDELTGQIEELRRVSLEEEIDELRGQIKKLRRRRKR